MEALVDGLAVGTYTDYQNSPKNVLNAFIPAEPGQHVLTIRAINHPDWSLSLHLNAY